MAKSFQETCNEEADMVMLASREFPSEECPHCDLDVGYVCPLCALLSSATFLARNVKCGNLIPGARLTAAENLVATLTSRVEQLEAKCVDMQSRSRD